MQIVEEFHMYGEVLTFEYEFDTVTEWLIDQNKPLWEMTLEEYAEFTHEEDLKQQAMPEDERELIITPDDWYEIYLKEKSARTAA